MLRLTGESFDGWLPLSPTPADHASGLRAVREAAEKAGRDPDSIATGVYLTVAVADNAVQATTERDAYVMAYYGAPAEVMAKSMALHAGTLESAAEWFAAYRAAGAQHLVLRLAHPRLNDYNETVRQLLGAASKTGR
jgi:alkanesulfonate monooxygenase SsuD/methylene tetrahydromethanopterin reductase-like flavin-dependent oxidoreductase (luciferase family)